MADTALLAASAKRPRSARDDRAALRSASLLIAAAVAFLALFLLLPLVAVFSEALRDGLRCLSCCDHRPDALAAIRLTLMVAAISVPPTSSSGSRRLGDRQIRVPGQELPDHADRPAVLRLAGDRRA